jgi:hypothetical protein
LLFVLLQNIFFSLFDSSAKVTLYLIFTFSSLVASAILLFKEYRPASLSRLLRIAVRGVLIAIIFVWSFWAFISSMLDLQAISFGLPLLWTVYAIGNFIALVSILMNGVSYSKQLLIFFPEKELPHWIVRADEVVSIVRKPSFIIALAAGALSFLYTILYTTGILVL